MQVVTLQNPALDAPLLSPGEPPMLAELQALAQRYAQQRTRAELGQAWRPGLSRLHKLMASLEAWLGYCPAKQRRQFLQSLQPMLQAAWGLHPQVQVLSCCANCCVSLLMIAVTVGCCCCCAVPSGGVFLCNVLATSLQHGFDALWGVELLLCGLPRHQVDVGEQTPTGQCRRLLFGT